MLQNHRKSALCQGRVGLKVGSLEGDGASLFPESRRQKRLSKLHFVQSFLGMLGREFSVSGQAFFDLARGNERVSDEVK